MIDGRWRCGWAMALGVVIGAIGGCDEAVDEDAAERVIADDERDDAYAVDRANPDEDEIEARAGGSCVGACGGQGSGGCWCDSLCAQYGDCCADKVAVCDGAPPPPPPPPPVAGEVPDNAYCADVASWPAAASDFEVQVVTLVNQRRAAGATCGQYGAFAPAGPVAMNPSLRCAGRKHDKDMIANNFFSHTGSGGTTPWDRIASAGYGGYVTAGENIAAGQTTPSAVVTGWMNSPGHCKNIMTAAFKEIGVGYATGGSYGHYWTQTFAAKN